MNAFPSTLLAAAVATALLISPVVSRAAAPASGTNAESRSEAGFQSLQQRIDRAVDHYTAGEFRAAEELLASIMRSDGATDRLKALAAFNRGAALLQLDRYDDAVEAFDLAEQAGFPYPGQLHLARGIAWERLGRPENAAHDYSSALVADPSNPAIRRRVDAFFYKK